VRREHRLGLAAVEPRQLGPLGRGAREASHAP
jgi:hypothetical protein